MTDVTVEVEVVTEVYEIDVSGPGADLAAKYAADAEAARADAATYAYRFVIPAGALRPYRAVIVNDAGEVLLVLGPNGKVADISLPYFDPITAKFEISSNALYATATVPGVPFAIVNSLGQVLSWTLRDGTQMSPRSAEAPTTTAEAGIADSVYDTPVRGGGFNQWIFPQSVRLEGADYGASMGAGDAADAVWGPLWAWKRTSKERFNPSAIGLMRAHPDQPDSRYDDHNGPCVLLDPRPAAAYPLMAFQAEHGSHPLRWWRSPTREPRDLALVGDINPANVVPNMGYAQFFRHPTAPDQIVGFSRKGGSTSAIWMIYRSLDNGATWSVKALFANSQMYFLSRPMLDGTGIHLICQNRPNSGADQRIIYMQYRWDGSIRVPGMGSPYVADVWDAGYSPVEPWTDMAGATHALIIRTPDLPQKRLFDAFETSAGVLEVCWAEFDPANYATGVTRHAVLTVGTATVVQSLPVAPCGSPFEETGDNSYVAGCAIAGPSRVVAAAWNGPGLPAPGFMALYTGGGVATAWSRAQVVDQGSEKIGRPIITADLRWSGSAIGWGLTKRVIFVRGSYQTFVDFALDVKSATLL